MAHSVTFTPLARSRDFTPTRRFFPAGHARRSPYCFSVGNARARYSHTVHIIHTSLLRSTHRAVRVETPQTVFNASDTIKLTKNSTCTPTNILKYIFETFNSNLVFSFFETSRKLELLLFALF